MSRTVWSRISAVLVLLLFLTPAVFAMPQQAKQARPGREIFSSFTQALGRLLPGIVKSSGTMDPDGKPQLATPPAITASDSSGTMDPDGRK
jgi:hypothetical protein